MAQTHVRPSAGNRCLEPVGARTGETAVPHGFASGGLWTHRLFVPLLALAVLAGNSAVSARQDAAGRTVSRADASLGSAPDGGALRFDHPSWSPDGRHLVFSDVDDKAVYVLDTVSGACREVAEGPSCGYAYNWSPDGRRLGLKLLIPREIGGFPLQVPAVYDVCQKRLTALHAPVDRAGVPSFAANGLVAFTIDQTLHVVGGDEKGPRTFALGHYANLAPLAPDGERVAYNSTDDDIWVLDITSGQRRQLTSGEQGFCRPQWSPDSSRLLVRTLTGRLAVIEVSTGRLIDLDEGGSPSWSPDGGRIFYCRAQRIDGVRVIESRIHSIGWDGTGGASLKPDPPLEDISAVSVSPDGATLACAGLASGEILQLELARAGAATAAGGRRAVASVARLVESNIPIEPWDGAAQFSSAALSAEKPETFQKVVLGQVRVIGSVPYIHQVYDTPNWFNGHWACGTTSAMMGISYYGILPYWDCTVSVPYSHVSHYGRYICEVYTYNGFTYNIGSEDPNGTLAYGGYGYIVRNDWADTKGYMRDYLIQHGLGSSVDWSPKWSELQTEVNNSTPFVLLNSLTSAGHYILTIGYFDNQHTAVFNDPYGNKNTGYVNYSGAGVYYDWPGYNNGYANLNTVHCFIYCRGSLEAPPTITQHPSDQSVCPGETATFVVAASGSGTLSYRWQKNGVDLVNGGHYAGATTPQLTVSNVDAADEAGYRCVVSNAYGSTTSSQALLSPRALTIITRHPSLQAVTEGSDAQFTVSATGDGVLTYQWQKNAVDLTNDGRISGVTTTTLMISQASDADEGSYRCVVGGGCGAATSAGAALIVNPPGVPGDFDQDDDVDQEDFAFLQSCLGTLDVLANPECAWADLSGNGRVETGDVTLFLGCLTGAGNPGDPGCTGL